MSRHVLVDTGPLVAYIVEEEALHEWAVAALAGQPPLLLTCEAVLTEAAYLIRRAGGQPDRLLELVQRGLIVVPFVLSTKVTEVRALMKKYANIPMSLADASLVVMSEEFHDCTLLTLDTDFTVYRRFGNEPISVLIPPR